MFKPKEINLIQDNGTFTECTVNKTLQYFKLLIDNGGCLTGKKLPWSHATSNYVFVFIVLIDGPLVAEMT